jgi:hypothetical protein
MRISERSGGRRLTVFPTWFLTKALKRKVDSVLPYHYRKRFRVYFNRYGCVRCNRKKALYGGNGLCMHCLGLVSDRLKLIDRKLQKREKRENPIKLGALLRRSQVARELLADFRQET